MTPVPLHLPLRANEAAQIADVLFQQAAGKRLTDDVRGRFANRLTSISTPSIRVHAGSLQADPTFPDTWYLAVDGEQQGVVSPLLLRIGLSSAPGSGIFPKSLLIGRLRAGGQNEVVINAIPFAAADVPQIQQYAEQVDRAFLPKPQGASAAVTVVVHDPAAQVEAAFALLRETGRPGACVELPNGAFWTGVWGAIRAGWRDGYSLAVALADTASVESALFFTRYSLPAGAPVAAIMDHVRRAKTGLPSGYPRMADFELDATAEELAALKADGRAVQFCRAASAEQAEAIRAKGAVPTVSATDGGGRVNLRLLAK